MKEKFDKWVERLKVAWYALTKRHYAFFAYDTKELGASGARCYIENAAEKDALFLECISDFALKMKSQSEDYSFYYFTFDFPDGNGSCTAKIKGEFDVMEAITRIEKDKGFSGVRITFWHPISEEQVERITKHYGNHGNEF